MDESIYDREEESSDHDHNSCGHTDEEHKRMDRVHSNFQKFLADNAEDLLDPALYEKIKKRVESHLKGAGVSMSYTSLKIFIAGFEFGIMTESKVPQDSPRIFAGIAKMLKEKQGKKVQIDITKSQPMPPKEDEKQD